MPHSTRSFDTSAPCRLDWRPSRWLIASVVALAVLAAFSTVASDLPPWAAWPLALLALAYGVRLARDEWRRPWCRVVIADRGAVVRIDGIKVERFVVQWRGPLAFARWSDGQGRTCRLVWWPDTLRRELRRELRLAAAAPATARPAQSMAT